MSVPSVSQASSHHPAHHHPTQSSSHMAGPCGAPSPTKLKSKPTWRCEVCDYETNVARNLRIHMTSEKHMHNMMLLQQNVTQMQHGRLGLGAMPSPSEAELYQYYLTQNMSLPPGLKIDPAGPESQFLMGSFHLDPNMAALAPSLGELLFTLNTRHSLVLLSDQRPVLFASQHRNCSFGLSCTLKKSRKKARLWCSA